MILALRNIVQVALFTNELRGQLSDGYWENSRPYDHWEPWCKTDIIVDAENPGRDFYVDRDRYNFAAPDLLNVVKDRMLAIGRVAKFFNTMNKESWQVADSMYDVNGNEFEEILWKPNHYNYTHAQFILKTFGSLKNFLMVTTDTTLLTEAQLRKELRDIGKIIKIRRRV